jgi:type IV pilus assembly protein PilM
VLRRRSSSVGIDIGSSAIKAVELIAGSPGHTATAVGFEPLPPGAVLHGLIRDTDLVSRALRELLDRLRIRAKQVAVALSSRSAIIKWIQLPAISDAELAASIEWEAEQHIGLDLDLVHLDYQPFRSAVGTVETMDVLLVAARKEAVDALTEVVRAAGRTPAVVDVTPFALQNVYEANYEKPERPLAIVDVGASGTTTVVIDDSRPLVVRDMAGGEAVIEGIQTALEIHAAGGRSAAITSIVVTGGATQSADVARVIGERLTLPVDVMNPFRRIPLPSALSEEEVAMAIGGSAAAVGLALRCVSNQ